MISDSNSVMVWSTSAFRLRVTMPLSKLSSMRSDNNTLMHQPMPSMANFVHPIWGNLRSKVSRETMGTAPQECGDGDGDGLTSVVVQDGLSTFDVSKGSIMATSYVGSSQRGCMAQ
mmetsp:Transcript_3897/g.9906  ORF Transcript_3897/g.9906 Transcript_3897/m.9906 type:complete len:116 (-) Transcript_3897:16-363(-)